MERFSEVDAQDARPARPRISRHNMMNRFIGVSSRVVLSATQENTAEKAVDFQNGAVFN